MTLAGRIWVPLVLCLITFLSFSPNFLIAPPVIRATGQSFKKESLYFALLVANVYINYYLSVTSVPGRIPARWKPEPHEIDHIRVCQYCRRYKPARAHHCRQCQKCTLKMDHHCPWINNCVGYYNQGHFLRFLLAVDAACSYHLWFITVVFFNPESFMYDPTRLQIFILALNYLGSFLTLVAVGILTLVQIHHMSVNETSVEHTIRTSQSPILRRGNYERPANPYDLGVYGNLAQVLGKWPIFWLVPQPMKGDGFSFPIAPQLHAGAISSSCTAVEMNALDDDDLDEQITAMNLPTSSDRVHVRRGSEGYEVRPMRPWEFTNEGDHFE